MKSFVADVPTIDRALDFCRSEIAWLDKKIAEAWATRKAAQMRDIMELLGAYRRKLQMTGMSGEELK